MLNFDPLTAPRHAARRHEPKGGRRAAGFTLVELVFYAATSGLILMATSIALLSSMSSNAKLEVYQRMEARLNRVNSLIQSETTEASEVSYVQSIPCDGVGSKSLFTLKIPYLSDQGNDGQKRESASIHYYQSGDGPTSELRRCGPPYKADGSLNFSVNPTDASIAFRTRLQVVETDPNKSNEHRITFTLSFYRPDDEKIKIDPSKPDSDPAAYLATTTATVGL